MAKLPYEAPQPYICAWPQADRLRSGDMQDGMRDYYCSQVTQTDWYAERKNESEPFDWREFASPPKMGKQ